PNHGASPHMLGIVDTADGMYYTSTEADGRSNGLVNYALGASRGSFLRSGAIAMSISVDRETHVSGAIFGDNYGYTAFRNGQGAFEARASRVVNGDGPEDDRVRLTWNVLHPNPITWYNVITGGDEVDLEYGRVYEVGFTWGGPDNDFELWIDGELAGSFDLPTGVELPWGVGGSATNLGLGANHERGSGATGNYASVAGLTYSDLQIWDEYRPFGGTSPPAEIPRLDIRRTDIGVELSWIAAAADAYIVHRSMDMQRWERFGEELSGETGERLVVPEAFDSNTPDDVFYRLEVLSGGGS
ncbi:MAG: hypothetical protein ACR2RV_19620, partial [Verrucomicrobiales bacterium]